MRFLGIDYGTKRIGIALSDEGGVLAFPKEIVSNDENAFEKIGRILEEENIKEVVVGESVDFAGAPNKISEDIKIFSEGLKKRFGVIIHKEKEFLTSVEARRYKDEGEKVDASAAALILQRFLDRNNK